MDRYGETHQRGIHWPTCIDGRCPGCMPVLPEPKPGPEDDPKLDLSIFRKH